MPPGAGPILVTGGTGTLGRPTVALLRAAGPDVRVLSRQSGPDRILGDLNTGAGLPEAVRGAETVLHLSQGGAKEDEQTRRIAIAARQAGVRHLLYISIVGVDRNPFPYYRTKLACEQIIRAVDGLPHTILRATQFHEFVARLSGADRPRRRIAWVPDIPVQPIAAAEVAARLVELVATGPSGRVPDIGGPEQGELVDFARTWYAVHRREPRIMPIRLPGRAFRAFRSGAQLAGLPGYGTQTFADWGRDAAAAG